MRAAELYAFMEEREAIRLRRAAGFPAPWTNDEILQRYRFTNVKRAHDRTTRELTRDFYCARAAWESPFGTVLFNCAKFRYFGMPEFARVVGWTTTQYDPNELAALAESERAAGRPVYTGAYIIRSSEGPKSEFIAHQVLAPLYKQRDYIADVASSTHSWRRTIETLSKFMGFGGTGFMAKEATLDLMLCPKYNEFFDDRNEWCPLGPGARRGLNRAYNRSASTKISDKQMLEELRALFAARVDYWSPEAVKLELHDIQFQLCEFDKYERARLGEGRPKRKFTPREKA